MADELKPRFPYSWFGKQWDPEKPIKFSPYVRRRYALSAATETGDKIISSTPPDLLKGEKALEWIYGLLGVLDQKASALMRLNGVMLAAAAFLLHPQYHAPILVTIAMAASAIGSTISIGCCLLVVSIDWPFLDLVGEESSEDGKRNSIFRRSSFIFSMSQTSDKDATGLPGLYPFSQQSRS
ncbi:MAG: hypothetical protein DME49_13175 [Verrucomicrobia bacterium]|nr:MAG: hypothetical protein DME49_13175 [Verrucomicrobiota bacterium]PYK94642.1 MAG: hypothetical protein DME36_04950 [Verrucomicrobiota bacterium]PYL58220.1 MAG: hypothetical protein DMF30_03475 [Verrucomicrobiota bacterium]